MASDWISLPDGSIGFRADQVSRVTPFEAETFGNVLLLPRVQLVFLDGSIHVASCGSYDDPEDGHSAVKLAQRLNSLIRRALQHKPSTSTTTEL